MPRWMQNFCVCDITYSHFRLVYLWVFFESIKMYFYTYWLKKNKDNYIWISGSAKRLIGWWISWLCLSHIIYFMVLPHVIFRSIWRGRNRRVFESIETPFKCLKDNFIKILYFWNNGKLSSSYFHAAKCVDSLYLIRIYIYSLLYDALCAAQLLILLY